MKIVQSKNYHRKPMSLPNKTSIMKNFKLKPGRKMKHTERKNISQLTDSLNNTNVSYFDSPCGIIECVEKNIINNRTKLNIDHDSRPTTSANTSTDLVKINKRRLKPRKRKTSKHKLENLSPKSSIVKMTHDTSPNDTGNAILQLCSDIRKTDNTRFSVLESLMLTGSPSELTENVFKFKGSNTDNTFRDNNTTVPRRNRPNNHSQIKTRTPPNTDQIKKKGVHDSLDSTVCSIVVNCNDTSSVAKFYALGSSTFLVAIKPESNLAVIGTVEIQLLKGSIDILGYKSYKEDEKLIIYSLQGSSHLSIKANDCNTAHLAEKSDNNLCEKLISLGLPEALLLKVSKDAESSVLFTVTRNKTDISSTVWPKFFENHSSFFVFPNTHLFYNGSRHCHIVERKINCLFETNLQELGLKEFYEVPAWPAVVNDILDQDYPKAILCGGKSVGKSSLLRYLVNKCLFKWKKILVLDFDLGQCEFTVPGCISATLVEEPLLGPNYSHLKQPKRSVYLGEVSVTKSPENYIEGCKSLINYASLEHPHIPWLVNTMGFTKGLGVSLACGIINHLRPTHVVQIQSKDKKMNFPSLLEPKFVNCLKHSAFHIDNNTMDYQLYEIPSGSEQQKFVSKSRGISPAESRNLVILSYMSRMLNSGSYSLSEVIPYTINMEQVDLCTTNKYSLTKAQVAAAMNGNMVALCHKRPLHKFHNCLGFGIVRAVDWQNGTIFLITPLPLAELSKVDCLVKGNVGLPDSLYYNQGDQVTGHVPYLSHTSGGSTARFAKRDFRSLPVTHK